MPKVTFESQAKRWNNKFLGLRESLVEIIIKINASHMLHTLLSYSFTFFFSSSLEPCMCISLSCAHNFGSTALNVLYNKTWGTHRMSNMSYTNVYRHTRTSHNATYYMYVLCVSYELEFDVFSLFSRIVAYKFFVFLFFCFFMLFLFSVQLDVAEYRLFRTKKLTSNSKQ